MALPKNATAFTMNVPFFKNGAIVVSPTLAIGDVKVSIAGAAEANITTLPTVKTYGAEMTLSAAEMTGGRTIVLFRDPDATWDDIEITLDFGNNTVDDNATQLTTIDDFLDTEITDIRNRIPAALIGGRIDASVGAMANGVQTTASYAAGAIDNTVLSTNAKQSIADALMATFVEGTITVEQMFQILGGALGGKISGADTGTVTIRNASDTANVIVATQTVAGRTTVTFTFV